MKRKRFHLDILPNRYGYRVRLIFDHSEGEKDYYQLEIPHRDITTLRTQGIDGSRENLEFIDWAGGEGYKIGWESCGWRLCEITFKGTILFGFEPIQKEKS